MDNLNHITKEELENYIYDLQANAYNGYWGPVIEKDGKYYLTTLRDGVDSFEMYDDLEAGGDRSKYYEITQVIDQSMSSEEAKKIFYDVDYSKVANAKPTYDIDEVNDYIKEVQNKIQEDVGKIDIHDDGSMDIYDLKGNIIVQGTKITENKDANSTSKYDLSSISNTSSDDGETVKLSDKLDDDNKVVIEGYLNQLTGQKDCQVVLKDGFYTTTINGEVIVFDKDTTLYDAINEVSGTFSSAKTINKKQSLATNKIIKKANNQMISIDVNTFNSVLSANNDAKGSIDSAKGSYSESCLTDKLYAVYATLAGGRSPTTTLEKSSDLVTSLSKKITYSLKAYDSIDHNLGNVINSIIGEIFSIDTYKNGETEEFYKDDLDDRLKKVDGIINDLSTKLDNLKKEYNERYPDGLLWFDNNITNLISGVGNGFGFVTSEDVKTNGNESGMTGQDVLTILNFMEENDLVSKLKAYSSDATWNSSGLAEVYCKKYLIDAEYSDEKYEEGEFLRKYLRGQVFEEDSKLKTIQTLSRNSTYRVNYFDNDLIQIKSYMKDQLSQFESLTNTITDYDGNEQELKGMELLSFYASDMVETESAISVTDSQVSNYKKYRLLMPYEADMNGDTYLEYLVQDWSKINVSELCPELNGKIQYMSQQELALYFMYKGISIKNGDEVVANQYASDTNASGYLDAMSDLINQRHGLEDAILRIADYNSWVEKGGIGGLAAFLQSGVDGFSDGLEGFFDGIGNVVLADGKKSSNDYRDAFMLSILGDSTGNSEISDLCDMLGIDNMDSTFKSVLKRNYTVFKSVGNMAIPTIVGFVSPLASNILVGLNTLGSSTEAAMQMQMEKSGETDATRAYLYGGLSALSSVAMNKLMSGIAGLNGNVTPPQGAGQFLTSMLKQGGRAAAGVYTDALLRATILNQPVDISKLPEQSIEQAINGMLTAAVMNGTTKLTFKIADGLVMNFSENYNSFQEMMADWRQQFNNSALGQKLSILKTIGGDKWKQQELKYDKTIVGKWMKENNGKSLMNLTDEADSIINFPLKEGQQLIFDPDNGGKYYIYDVNAESALALSNNFLSTREGVMHITPTDAEYDFGAYLRYGEGGLLEVQLSRWAFNELPKHLKEFYNVSDEILNEIGYKFKFYSNVEEWRRFLIEKEGYTEKEASVVAGLHSRKSDINSLLVMKDYVWWVKHNIDHEGLHGCGNLGRGSRGLTEALTEKFATDMGTAEGYVKKPTAYIDGVDAVNRLMGKNIPGLTQSDFQKAYFVDKSDASIRATIDGIMGEGYYDRILTPAFNQHLGKAHLTASENVRLNDAVDRLIDTYAESAGD